MNMSCLNSSAPDVSSAWNSFLRTCLDLIVLNFLNLYLKVNFLMRLSQTILLKIKFLTPHTLYPLCALFYSWLIAIWHHTHTHTYTHMLGSCISLFIYLPLPSRIWVHKLLSLFLYLYAEHLVRYLIYIRPSINTF